MQPFTCISQSIFQTEHDFEHEELAEDRDEVGRDIEGEIHKRSEDHHRGAAGASLTASHQKPATRRQRPRM